MSITIDDLGKAEDFSQQLEDMGLLAAYHHVLQAIAARRVSIPESHLYEFAAREFERYGQRRKGGMINLKQEERVSAQRQRQVARRIHDKAREFRFAKNYASEEDEEDRRNLLQLAGIADENEEVVAVASTTKEEEEEEEEQQQEDVKHFLMDGVMVENNTKNDDRIDVTEEQADITNFLMEGVVVKNGDEEDKEVESSSSGNIVETLQERRQQIPTPDVLLHRTSAEDNMMTIGKEEMETIDTIDSRQKEGATTINGETTNSKNEVDLASLQVFAPMLLKVIFDSIDKEDHNNATELESKTSPDDVSVQSSDLSDGSDLSLLSESMEESNKRVPTTAVDDDGEDGDDVVLDSLDIERDVTESTTLVEENGSSMNGLISVSLEDTEK